MIIGSVTSVYTFYIVTAQTRNREDTLDCEGSRLPDYVGYLRSHDGDDRGDGITEQHEFTIWKLERPLDFARRM